MINKKGIIILAIVLVVLVGAFVAVEFLWTGDAPENPGPSSDTIEVFTTAKENVSRISVAFDDESFAFVKDDEGKWYIEGDKTARIKNSTVDYLCIELCGIYAQGCIDENAADVAVYGLDNPAGTYTLDFIDGTTRTFLLGDMDPVGKSYYFKVAEESKVYTIFTTKGQALSNRLSYYRNADILDVDDETLSHIYVKSSKGTLELKKRPVPEGEETVNIWDMVSPVPRECDTQPIHDYIISKVAYISVKEFIDVTDSRYTSSGVASPEAVLELADESGSRQTIYVGKAEGDDRYIKTGDRVYLVPGNAFGFLDMNPFTYVSKFINLEHIDDVSRIVVTHNGVTHTAEIDGEKDAYTYKFNGSELMEETFKRQVYQKVVGLLADEFAMNPRRTTPEYTVTFYFRNGLSEKTEYCSIDDRSYAAFDGNGRCEFIIRKKKLNEMFASLDGISTGRSAE